MIPQPIRLSIDLCNLLRIANESVFCVGIKNDSKVSLSALKGNVFFEMPFQTRMWSGSCSRLILRPGNLQNLCPECQLMQNLLLHESQHTVVESDQNQEMDIHRRCHLPKPNGTYTQTSFITEMAKLSSLPFQSRRYSFGYSNSCLRLQMIIAFIY